MRRPAHGSWLGDDDRYADDEPWSRGTRGWGDARRGARDPDFYDDDEMYDDEDEMWEVPRSTGGDIAVRVLSVVGRVLITSGVLVLLFVAYQLWGTGVHEARAQGSLSNEFEAALGEAGIDPEASTDDSVPVVDPNAPLPPPPAEGAAVANIRIPRIGVDKVVVEGVSVSDLKRGPGHYPDSPLPGQPGNAAIAGHRTTYGAPFNRIDELQIGDEILVTTLQGAFRYEVSEQQIVSPDQVEVLGNFNDNRLTLTACHPKYSARQRIIVVAQLVGPAATAAEPTAPTETPADDAAEAQADGEAEQASSVDLDGGLSGQRTSAWPAVLLGLACGLIWLAAWVGSKLVDRWIAYAVGAPLFFLVLFFFYESFYRLLPANF
jgi:sortase A